MVPVGTSAAVSASYNRSGVTRRQMTSYRAIGVKNAEAIDFETVAVNNMGSSISRSLDVESGGFSIASLFTRNSDGQINSPNMTRDNRTALSDFNYNAFSSEEEITAADKTFTLTNSNGSGIIVALIATFR